MYVNFIHDWWGLHFNVDSERGICETLHGKFILNSVLDRKLPRENEPVIKQWPLCKKPAHYTLHYGDIYLKFKLVSKTWQTDNISEKKN